MKKLVFIIFLLFKLNAAYAGEVILAYPEDEARAKSLFALVRCTVCKGQSIKDSNADIAIILRQSIREQIREGKNNSEILESLEARYGEEIVLKPKFDGKNLTLWLFPSLLGLLGIYLILRNVRFKK